MGRRDSTGPGTPRPQEVGGVTGAQIGDWLDDVPPAPLSQAARTLELDSIVRGLKERPGVWRLVDTAVGRGGGCSSSLRARGCDIRTRHDNALGQTEIWARWPKAREVPGNPGGRSSGA